MKTILKALILLCFYTSSFGQKENVKFYHLSSEDGLSQASVDGIIQDEYGFMWFATQEGLDRYDGYEFKVFKHDPLDPRSISDSYVTSLYKDRNGGIWIGTENGLNKYDQTKENFIHYHPDTKRSKTSDHLYINEIYEAESLPGILWIGTKCGLFQFDIKNESYTYFAEQLPSEKKSEYNLISCFYEAPSQPGILWIGTSLGLYKHDIKTGKNKIYTHKPYISSSISNSTIISIFEDSKGVLWIGTEKGINIFERDKNNFIHFNDNKKNNTYVGHNRITSIFEDKALNLWVGTYGEGLNLFLREKHEFYNYKNETGNPNSISDNFISNIFEDKSGILWIGTQIGGLSKIIPNTKKFIHHYNNPNNPNSLINNDVRNFYKCKNGLLLIGTYGGFECYDSKTKKYTHYSHNPANKNSLSSNFVRYVYEDNSGIIWIGTYNAGLNKFDPGTKKFTHYKIKTDKSNSLKSNYIRTIHGSKDGYLWLGTVGGGMCRFDPENETFKNFLYNQNDTNSINGNRIYSIVEDSSGMLWLGTDKGLAKFDPGKEIFTRYESEPDNLNGLSHHLIMGVFIDRNAYVWACTYGGGINKLDTKTGIFTRYTEKNGLPSNAVYGILEDKKGILWMSTNKGIAAFDPENKKFKNYSVENGLQNNEYNSGAYHKDKTGKMYFGGINGYNSFYPDSIKNSKYIPPIVITEFKLFNKNVPIIDSVGVKSILKKSILETDTIELTYKENVFSFNFAALHYVFPEKNEFAYILENFETEWNYVGDRRFVNYTSLPAGEYTFRVKGSNSDGVWNEKGVAIKIILYPPWWKTKLFYVCLTVFIILIIGLYIKLRERKLKKDKQNLEKKVSERTKALNDANTKLEEHQAELMAKQEEIIVQKDAIQEQNTELEKLSIVARETDNIVIIMDNKGNVEWANESFDRVFGHTIQEHIEKYGRNLLESSTNDKIHEIIKKCINTKKTVIYESTAIHTSGNKTALQTTLTPILDDEDNIIKLITIDSNIQELKEAEKDILAKNKKIGYQNKQIKSSIVYAQTIQQSILPPINDIQKHFDMFLIFKPKDIVSGDFYWYSHMLEYAFFAIVDCTGHGVPGAFMSMIGNRILSEIVNEKRIFSPEKILKEMHLKIAKTLRQKKTKNTDGMDVCLCRIEKKKEHTVLIYSGAKRPIFISKNNGKIQSLKGDRSTIGGFLNKKNVVFTNQEIVLNKGNTIYLTTDGYADQNNKERKCFGRKRLLNLLKKISLKPMPEQKEALESELRKWQKDESQRDDIAIWGIKI